MIDTVALAALFSLITTLTMQVLKPLLERLPGVMLPQNQEAHDGLLRLVQYAINFGLLFVTWKTTSAFAGLHYQWYDLLAIAAGQALLSHVTYKSTTTGKADILPPVEGEKLVLAPAAAPRRRHRKVAHAPTEPAATTQITADTIPTVPRT